MERQFPKNVKQIGNVSDSPRIYVEDYVETFLNQLEEQGREVTITAFLLGEKVQIEGEECIFVTGALQVKDSISEEINPVITKEELETAKVESREYFHEMDIIGWFQTVPDRPLALRREMAKAHEKLLPEKNSLLILKGQEEELYFAYKFKELMEIGGHYIFYEKNPDMQSYMIRERRQIGVTPSEVVEDRAAKDFRSTIKGRMEVREQRRESRYVYLTSVLLVVIVLAIGISTMNNYDKMNSVQNSIETLSSNMGANGSSGKNTQQDAQNDRDTQEAQSQDAQNSDEQSDQQIAEQTGQGDQGESAGGTDEASQETNGGTTPDPSTIQEELQGASEEYYVVQKGDTLDLISKKLYGTTSETDAICRMNGLKDGNLIFIGQKLLLP